MGMDQVRTDKWVFIVNPTAGNGFAGRYLAELKGQIAKRRIDAKVVLTRAKGHATELSLEHARGGCSHIVGVGGDGTFGEIAQPLVHRRDIVFGAVPAGTGNDFIHILGFPNRFTEKEWDAFFAGRVAEMDVGRCNGVYFLNGMGAGFDAQVAAENYRGGREVKGGNPLKYQWHIIKNIFLYRERSMKMTLEERTEQRKVFLHTIGNGRRFAGGLQLTPKAFANDGLLDVCMIPQLSVPDRLKAFSDVKAMRIVENPNVRYVQTSSMTLEFEEEVPAHLDGELQFSRRFEVSVVPGGLRVLYDPAGEHGFLAKGS